MRVDVMGVHRHCDSDGVGEEEKELTEYNHNFITIIRQTGSYEDGHYCLGDVGLPFCLIGRSQAIQTVTFADNGRVRPNAVAAGSKI